MSLRLVFQYFKKNWDWFVSDFQKTVVDFTDGITVNNNGCFIKL